jgi:hypothetical protein
MKMFHGASSYNLKNENVSWNIWLQLESNENISWNIWLQLK